MEGLNVILSGRASPRMGGQERARGSGGVGGVCADHIMGVLKGVWILQNGGFQTALCLSLLAREPFLKTKSSSNISSLHRPCSVPVAPSLKINAVTVGALEGSWAESSACAGQEGWGNRGALG